MDGRLQGHWLRCVRTNNICAAAPITSATHTSIAISKPRPFAAAVSSSVLIKFTLNVVISQTWDSEIALLSNVRPAGLSQHTSPAE